MTTMAEQSNTESTVTATTEAATAENDVNSAAADAVHNGREARNLAEKQRRDKLNASIQELATMVPHVAESTRRLDKTAVLRFATHGLRLQYVFGKSASRRKRRHCLKSSGSSNGNEISGGSIITGAGGNAANIDYTPPQLTDTLMQLLDSFFLTLTCNGQIVLISASVEQLLGHCQSDLYGQNILQITHPEDQALLRQQLIPRDIQALFLRDYQATSEQDDDMDVDQDELNEDDADNQPDYNYRTPSPRTLSQLAAIDERLRSDRRCFTVRLSRASTRSEATRSYEVVKIDGCFRRSDSSVTGGAGNFPIVSQLIRRSRNSNNVVNGSVPASNGNGLGVPCLPQHDAIAQAALHGISGNDIVLVAMARIIREPRVMFRQPEANQLEYRTRHLIDGRIIDCDQRIGIVAGYMKDEVRNLSPFSFMHQDDVRWVIVALRQMYDCNSDYGESCYRLLSRNGHFIYLQTKGYLEIDKSSNQVHSFLCVNTLLDEEEGKRRVQAMKNKFSTIINAKIPTNSLPDLPASRNPQQLERIVLYLIENLQKTTSNGEQATNGANDFAGLGCYEMRDLRSPGSAHEDYAQSPSPAQPTLALVPPEASSVKNSISKSVNVVNITAAKNLQYQQRNSPGVVRQHSQESLSVSTLSPASSMEQSTEETVAYTSPTTTATTIATKTTTTTTSTSPTSPVLQRTSVLQRLPLSITITTTPIASASTPTASNSPVTPRPANDNKCNPVYAASASTSTSTSSSPAMSPSSSLGTSATLADAHTPAHTPTKLHAALSSSLRRLDNNLQTLGEKAETLCQQRALLLPEEVPCQTRELDRQLDAILVEHQKQKKLLVNIKSEFNVHLQQQQQTAVAVEAPSPHAAEPQSPESPVQQRAASVITSNVSYSSRQRQNRRPL